MLAILKLMRSPMNSIEMTEIRESYMYENVKQ